MTTIYLTRKQSHLRDGKEIMSLDWDGLDMTSLVNKWGSKLKKARLILGNDVTYVLAMAWNGTQRPDRLEVIKMFQPKLPTPLVGNFDWQIKGKYVQIAALPIELYQQLVEVGKSVEFDQVIPAAVLLASQLDTKEASLVTIEKPEAMIVAVDKGVALGTFDPKLYVAASLKELPIAVADDQKTSDADIFELMNSYGPTQGSDEKVLGFDLRSLDKEAENVAEVAGKEGEYVAQVVTEKKTRPWLLGKGKMLMVSGGVALLALIGGGVWVAKNSVKQKPAEVTAVVELITPTPEPTPDLTSYLFQVLNGSGKAGEAQKAAEILKTVGFSQVDVGNAGAYDFKGTEVSWKADVPGSIVDLVMRSLGGYETTSGATLTVDSAYDVLITVGSIRRAE